MENIGWISLHRKIFDSFIYPKNREFTKYEAWIDLLLIVNHNQKPVEVSIGNEVFECKIGQSIRSIKTYQGRWNWTPQKVRSFFKMLQSKNMIELNPNTKTTILTICNYESYQDKQQTDNKRITNEKQTDNKRITTNNNDNNNNNENNDNKPKEQIKNLPPAKSISLEDLKKKKEADFKAEFWRVGKTLDSDIEFWTKNDYKEAKRFCNYWTESKPRGKKLLFEFQKTFDIKKRMITWLNNAEKFNPKEKEKSGVEIMKERLEKKYYGNQ